MNRCKRASAWLPYLRDVRLATRKQRNCQWLGVLQFRKWARHGKNDSQRLLKGLRIAALLAFSKRQALSLLATEALVNGRKHIETMTHSVFRIELPAYCLSSSA